PTPTSKNYNNIVEVQKKLRARIALSRAKASVKSSGEMETEDYRELYSKEVRRYLSTKFKDEDIVDRLLVDSVACFTASEELRHATQNGEDKRSLQQLRNQVASMSKKINKIEAKLEAELSTLDDLEEGGQLEPGDPCADAGRDGVEEALQE
ncbi:hypothetical protein BGZ82_009960, partial [Podila clonocystis]